MWEGSGPLYPATTLSKAMLAKVRQGELCGGHRRPAPAGQLEPARRRSTAIAPGIYRGLHTWKLIQQPHSVADLSGPYPAGLCLQFSLPMFRKGATSVKDSSFLLANINQVKDYLNCDS